MPNQEVIELRNRILGILIQNARDRSRVSRREAAAALGITSNRLSTYESGQKAISLPELELLARYLEVPLREFRSTEGLKEQKETDEIPNPEVFIPLRDRVIGARLRQVRLEADRTQQDLADILECSSSSISDYEYGRRSISVAELEILARALAVPLDYFIDQESEVGEWHKLQEQYESFVELSDDIREFVLRPINRSYLELAMKLAQMPAGALRSIAEGLLEITY